LPAGWRGDPEVLVPVNPDFPERHIIAAGWTMNIQPHLPRVSPPTGDVGVSADILAAEVLATFALCPLAVVPDPIGHFRKQEISLPRVLTLHLMEG